MSLAGNKSGFGRVGRTMDPYNTKAAIQIHPRAEGLDRPHYNTCWGMCRAMR